MMENQAMSLELNFDDIQAIQKDIAKFERELAMSKKFDAVWSNEDFQKAVMIDVFMNEAEKLALSLTKNSVTDERAQTILFELKSLKFVKELLFRKSNNTEKLESSLKTANKLLLDKMSNKD